MPDTLTPTPGFNTSLPPALGPEDAVSDKSVGLGQFLKASATPDFQTSKGVADVLYPHPEGAIAPPTPASGLPRSGGAAQAAATQAQQAEEWGPLLSANELNKRYNIPGELNFTEPTYEPVAKKMYAEAQGRLGRDWTIQAGDTSNSRTIGGFAAQFVAQSLDPVNVASAFVPGVGEERYAQILASVGSKIGARAIKGGIDATVGNTLVMPFIAASQKQEGQPGMDLGDMAKTLGYGAALGGILHPLTGAFSDRMKVGFTPDLHSEATKAAVNDILNDRPVAAPSKVVALDAAGKAGPVSLDQAKAILAPERPGQDATLGVNRQPPVAAAVEPKDIDIERMRADTAAIKEELGENVPGETIPNRSEPTEDREAGLAPETPKMVPFSEFMTDLRENPEHGADFNRLASAVSDLVHEDRAGQAVDFSAKVPEYKFDEDSIGIPKGSAEYDTPVVRLHEAMHMLTSSKIRDSLGPIDDLQGRAFHAALIEYAQREAPTDKYGAGVQNLAKLYLHFLNEKAIPVLGSGVLDHLNSPSTLMAHVADKEKFRGMYGINDLHEFVAESFTNPKFQQALAETKAPEGMGLGNMFSKLVKVIRDMLGLKRGDEGMLKAVLQQGAALAKKESPDVNAPKGKTAMAAEAVKPDDFAEAHEAQQEWHQALTRLALNKKVYPFITSALRLNPDMTIGEAIKAFNDGSVKLLKGARNSVDSQGKARGHVAVGKFDDALRKSDGGRDFDVFTSGKAEANIYEEMHQLDDKGQQKQGGQIGITGNPAAARIAKIARMAQIEQMMIQNQYGGLWRPRKGFAQTQLHDATRVRTVGGYGPGSQEKSFQIWKADQLKWIGKNHDLVFGDKNPDRVLDGDFRSIITDSHGIGEDASGAAIRGTSGYVYLGGASRKLIYEDWRGEMANNQKYGAKTFKDYMYQNLLQMGRRTSLMENWGPNYVQTFSDTLKKFATDTKEWDNAKEHADSLKSPSLIHSWLTLTGQLDRPADVRVHKITLWSKAIAFLQHGGHILIAAMSDKPLGVMQATYDGVKPMKAMANSVLAMLPQGVDTHSMMRRLGVEIHGSLGSIAARFSDGVTARTDGALFGLQNFISKWGLLNWWTDDSKGGHAAGLANLWAENADRPQSELPKEIQNAQMLQDISSHEWDAIRPHVQEIDGKQYLTPDAVAQISDAKMASLSGLKDPSDDALSRARDSLENKLATYFVDNADRALPTPGNAERSFMLAGTRPGTYAGAALRMFWMFKGLLTTVVTKQIQREIYGQGSKSVGDWLLNNRQGNWRMIQLIASTTVAGYLSGMIDDLRNGKKPKDPIKAATIADAMIRGGGGGIMGDMLMTQYDNSYNNPLTKAAGPIFGQAAQAVGIASQAVYNINKPTKELPSAYHFVVDNFPLINLFYVRPVLNYLFLYSLQNMVSPGSLQRQEKSAQQDYNQSYWLKPSDEIKASK